MKRLSQVIIVLAITASLSTALFAGDVRVKGYIRKDGTYVPPHHRSEKDGRFSNNWSTKGNLNPYTREWGDKTHPSNGSFRQRSTSYIYRESASDNLSSQMRRFPMPPAQIVKPLVPSKPGTTLIVDYAALRAEELNRLQQLGVEFDSFESISSLRALRLAAETSLELRKRNIERAPTVDNYSQLEDLLQRVLISEELLQLGIRVDPESHTFSRLLEMRTRALKSRR